MPTTRIEAGFLNIVATPHPAGTYKRLLKKVAGKQINFWGNDAAAISPPKERDNDFLSFQLIIWTEVNPKMPAIRKAQLEKEEFPREGKEFAATFGVNGKTFYCIFDTSKHLLTVEIRNDEGATISLSRLDRIFSALFDPERLDADDPEVQVTVMPREGALEYVLGLDRLDKVEMFLKIPNQDDVSREAHEIMKKLQEQNAKSERRVLSRQAKTDGIKLSAENKVFAKVASHNGFVEATGRGDEGEHDKRSTRDVPKIVKRSVENGASFLAALRDIARDARNFYD